MSNQRRFVLHHLLHQQRGLGHADGRGDRGVLRQRDQHRPQRAITARKACGSSTIRRF